MDNTKNQSGSNVYQKVVFVIISCGIALGLAYFISKIAFDEMLNKVNIISTPNEKLRLVSRISRDILQIDQVQRAQVLNHKDYTGFVNESDFILQSLDTLKGLYPINSLQSNRIDSIRILLNERDKLFNSYIQVRKNLVDNQAFSNQIKNISSLIQEVPKTDSRIITTEKKVTTKTIDPSTEVDNRGFFAKLFGVKSKPESNLQTDVPQTVHEELNVKIDTIKNVRDENTEAKIDQAIQDLEARQRQKSATFVNHETELTLAGNILVSDMFNILHEVEQEAMHQMEFENLEARTVVNQSVRRISFILLSFFLISAVLIYFILTDLRKGTNYRLALENAKNAAEYHGAAKQRFLSNMSHELRTPLQSIIGYAEQLRYANKDAEKINVIYQSSQHLLQIVNEVLDYNRINSGKFNFQKEVLNLKDLAEEVATAMHPQAKQKNIELNLSTRISGSGLVLGDAFRLKQILFNLVGNAIKFTDRGEVLLQITSTDYGDNTDINYRIQDTGPGIPPEDIDKIFDEFEQSTNSDSGTHFGNGLGLSIVKTLIKAMSGQIEVKSMLEKGSVFTVTFSLPTSTSDQIALPAQPTLMPASSFKNTVWLIDDDTFILDLCHNILNKYCIDHQCFKSPKDALDQPSDQKPSHIFTDMRMPEINGKDLYKELREKYDNSVKIIAFTAQALPEERKDILSFGFDGLLLKPFKEADLLEALGVLADRKDFIIDEGQQVINNLEGLDEAWIMKLFTNDTEKDLKELYDSFHAHNYSKSELLVHRLAGRTAQLGGDHIAFKLRKMEIDLRNGESLPMHQIKEIDKLLQQFILDIHKKEVS